MAGLTAETVRNWAKEAQDIAVPPADAAATARAVETLAAAARKAAGALPFDAEPAEFLTAQRRWLRQAR